MAKNYSRNLYNDYEKIQALNEELLKKLKYEKLRADIAEDEQRRLQSIVDKKDNEFKELKEKYDELARAFEKIQVMQNNDGTCAGIPTSQTPLNKKKVIPNFAKNTGDKIGRKKGHKKDKLERISDEEINEEVSHSLEECLCCKSHNLVETGNVISKDELDYQIIPIKRRHNYVEYKCQECGKVMHKEIPNHLKEECQYGSNVKCIALTLNNVGNVPLNKIRRILSGLSLGEIEPCEGYLAKLNKVTSKKLTEFVEDARKHLVSSSLIQWDDTSISINKKQSCMRYYGNSEVCLFIAHEKKDKEGIDADKILTEVGENTAVVHDHNKVNYNPDYSFINVECCQHLLRDLKKVEINIPERTWCTDAIKLFQEFDHQRNELILINKDSFSNEEINNFIIKLDGLILRGLEENEKNNKPYYSGKELTLLNRMMEYRDNYIYWLFDFNIPFTNNLSERSLRGIKSKMKISGQFQNIDRAQDYARIRTYIETCRLYEKNEYESLTRLVEDNPFTLEELLESKK